MSTDTENGVAAAKEDEEVSRTEETEEKEEKKTPRKRAPSEKKEGERKSGRAPKQITPFKPPEPKDGDAAVTIPAGKGTPIGDIANCVTALKSYKVDDKCISKLHSLMFGGRGKRKEYKQNIRLFKGFAPGEDRAKHLKKATQSKLEVKDLRPICHVLDIERSGTRDELIERIVDFLLNPKESGKAYKGKDSGSTKKGQKRKGSSKKKKDKESSGRAPSGYIMFVKAKRASVAQKNPKAGFGEVGRLVAAKWNKLSDAEKEEWAEKGRKEGPKKDKAKKSSTKKSKKSKKESSDEESSSSSEEEEEEVLSDAIRAKIKSILASGMEQLTIRQIKEQLKTEFANEVENKGAIIKAFVHKCVENP